MDALLQSSLLGSLHWDRRCILGYTFMSATVPLLVALWGQVAPLWWPSDCQLVALATWFHP